MADPLAAARALLRLARAGFHRPTADERPRCGKPGRWGPCQAPAVWVAGEPRPRRRCAMHLRSKALTNAR